MLPVSAVSMNGGTIDLNTFSVVVGGLSGSAGTVTNSGSGTPTLNVNGSGTFGGLIRGGVTLTKSGVGTLTLQAANTYTGATNVSGGTLRQGATNAIPNVPLTVTGGTLDLAGFNASIPSPTLSGGTIQGGGILNISGNTLTASGTCLITGGIIFFGSTPQYTFNVSGGTLTVDSRTSADGGVTTGQNQGPGFIKNGAGTLIMTNSGNLVGCTGPRDEYFNAGTVINGASNALGGDILDYNMPALVMSGTAVWNLNNFYQAYHSLGGTATNTIDLNGGTLRLAGEAPQTYSGTIIDSKNTGDIHHEYGSCDLQRHGDSQRQRDGRPICDGQRQHARLRLDHGR